MYHLINFYILIHPFKYHSEQDIEYFHTVDTLIPWTGLYCQPLTPKVNSSELSVHRFILPVLKFSEMESYSR